MHYSQSTLINLSLCPIIGKQRNTNVGTHLCQFLPSLRSTVRIHCPLLLMRNDDDDQLLLLLANEDKLTSAAHRKSASSTIQKAFLSEIFLWRIWCCYQLPWRSQCRWLCCFSLHPSCQAWRMRQACNTNLHPGKALHSDNIRWLRKGLG